MIFRGSHYASAAPLLRGAVLLMLAGAVLFAGQAQAVHAASTSVRDHMVDPFAGPWFGGECLALQSATPRETDPRARASGASSALAGNGLPCSHRPAWTTAAGEIRKSSPSGTLLLICRLNR